MKYLPNRRALILISIVLVVLVAGVLLATQHHTSDNPTAHHSKTTADINSSQKNTSPSKTADPQQNAPTSQVSDADKQAAADGRPIADACTLLSASIAKQIVGTDAHSVVGSSTTSLQANDTTITNCAYTGQNGTVQLTIRAPSGHVGMSENDVQFGSGRPSGVVTESGYGQAAYWNPADHTLNVLGSNNWYIISRNTNTQADSEAAAKLLTQGF